MYKVTPPQSLDRRSSSSRLPPIEDAFPTRPAETDPDLYSDSDEEDSDEIMDSLAEPVESTMEDAYPDPEPQPLNDAHAPHFVDWLDNTLKRPVSFVAEKTCEMICYLWFATALPSPSPHPSHSPPQHPRTNTNTTALQLAASPAFIAFLQKVLETTQVGQSVIVLSLHYIYLLKARNCLAAAQAGSEFRIAIAALMMANKFLDDNTYTNRTWSDVSGIGLEEVNRMEREFLVGVGWECFVDGATYGKWRDLLRGLVAAKERDRRMWNGKGVRAARSSGRLGHGTPSKGYAARNGRAQPPQTRARSTSPSRFAYAFEFTAPHSISPPQPHTRSGPASSQPYSASSLHPSAYNTPSTSTSNYDHPAYADTFSPTPNPRSGCKRHATDAFSPDFRPSKAQKPTPGSLLIPEHPQTQPQRNSPLDSLQAFATMSLASSNGAPYTPESRSSSPAPGPAWNHHREPEVPHTLVAAYRAGGPVNVPQVRSLIFKLMDFPNSLCYRTCTTTPSPALRMKTKRRTTGARRSSGGTSPPNKRTPRTTRRSACSSMCKARERARCIMHIPHTRNLSTTTPSLTPTHNLNRNRTQPRSRTSTTLSGPAPTPTCLPTPTPPRIRLCIRMRQARAMVRARCQALPLRTPVRPVSTGSFTRRRRKCSSSRARSKATGRGGAVSARLGPTEAPF